MFGLFWYKHKLQCLPDLKENNPADSYRVTETNCFLYVLKYLIKAKEIIFAYSWSNYINYAPLQIA